jgi:hypothetical protein
MKVLPYCGHKLFSQPVAVLPDRWSTEIAIDCFRKHPIVIKLFCRRSFLTLRGQAQMAGSPVACIRNASSDAPPDADQSTPARV